MNIAVLYAAQQLSLPVHVSHLSALSLYGVTHYQLLEGREAPHPAIPLPEPKLPPHDLRGDLAGVA